VEEKERERERERKREGYSLLWGRRAHRIAIYDFSGASTDVGVLNKTHPFLCSLSRILPISRRPTPCDPSGSLFLSLSLSLPLPLSFSLSPFLSFSAVSIIKFESTYPARIRRALYESLCVGADYFREFMSFV